jgi:hypothetical protein
MAEGIHKVGVEAVAALKALRRAKSSLKVKTAKAKELIEERNDLARPLLKQVHDAIADGKTVNSCTTWEQWAKYAGWSKRALNYVLNGRPERKGGNHGSRDTGPVPRLNRADRKALIEGNHRANELAAALEADRDGKKEIASFKAVMDAKRLDDIVQAHFAEPDDLGGWLWLKVGSKVIVDGIGYVVHSAEVSKEKGKHTTHVLSATLYSLSGVIHTKAENGFPECRRNEPRRFGEGAKDYLYAENGGAPSCERCAEAVAGEAEPPQKAAAAD